MKKLFANHLGINHHEANFSDQTDPQGGAAFIAANIIQANDSAANQDNHV